jgi:hypothetical protein
MEGVVISTAEAILRLKKLADHGRSKTDCLVQNGTHPIGDEPSEFIILTARGEWERIRAWELDPISHLARLEGIALMLAAAGSI